LASFLPQSRFDETTVIVQVPVVMLLSVILQLIITTKRVLWESISRSCTPLKSQTPKSTHQTGTFKAADPTFTSEILLLQL
jgi:hypothetical protein